MLTPMEVADLIWSDYHKGSIGEREAIQHMVDEVHVPWAEASDLVLDDERPSQRWRYTCKRCGHQEWE